MSPKRDSDSPPNSLSLRERTILEFCAEGIGDAEIAARLRLSRSAVSAIRSHTAARLAKRIATAHPFQISEIVLAR